MVARGVDPVRCVGRIGRLGGMVLFACITSLGCSFPLDEFSAPHPPVRDTDPTLDASADDSVTDTSALDGSQSDTSSPLDTLDTLDASGAPDTLVPDTLVPDALVPDSLRPDTRDSATCVCVSCPGASGKCKAYDPPGCGEFNGPC